MQFPKLFAPYDVALAQAVDFILDRYDDVLGIIASGTIITGNPGPNSDLDIVVIVRRHERQRLQRFFNGVPAELFVNPPHVFAGYFEVESQRGRPSMPHMLTTGLVILANDPVVEQLRQEAKTVLDNGPTASEYDLTYRRYGAATWYEDARDVDDPATVTLILNRAVYEMLHYAFLKARRWIPRDKDLLDALADLDTDLASWARAFFTSDDLSERRTLAKHIADATIATDGFFEFDSPIESVDP